ncbi:nitroreductase family protein [Moorellaceae bacterium AZ2]
MDLYEAIRKRRSIRKYKPDMVPRETIARLLEQAMWAPSGLNWQQWEFMVVTGPKKEELAASYGRITEFGFPPAGQRTPAQESFIQWAKTLGGAPVAIVALTPAYGDPAVRKMNLESVSAAFAYLLLAATAEGLGTCWMTGPLRNEKEIRRILEIPDDKEIVAMTPLGYPDEEPAPPPRKDQQEKIQWLGF